MTLDGNIRHRQRLDADVYEETPESLSSPRGLGETSVVSTTWMRHDDELLLLELDGKRYYVPRAVLIAVMKLRP